MKKILLLFLTFLTIDVYAQSPTSPISKTGDMVSMPVYTYRILRAQILLCDSLNAASDSLQVVQHQRLAEKDTIIALQGRSMLLKDSVIAGKNETIRELNLNFDKTYQAYQAELNKPFYKTKGFWIGVGVGGVTSLLLTRKY